ncbi:CPBP family intramembrane glutamic endopeptidase [Gramella sp. KN1008]|uniref:CPBP family intramembrane glutamic endopeptidase n=1 Tax=Gramella sp. KN1008 TaxID=2529298 RepID=UPI00103962EB|nr:type II CAAX endopeptidase family protein [Gramella sp. KN1008]TBW30234.1 CPBP family intramembrane metalloprotease [Gramella sp. KN1008]
MKKSSKLRIAIFVGILAGLTLLSRIISLPGNWNMFLVMWIPGLAALLTMLFTALPLRSVGWRFNFKWMAIGWLLPVSYGAITYGIIWLTGLGGVPKETFLERARFTMGMSSENDLLIIISAFFFISLVNLLPNMLLSLGEELGWRGFLVPQLIKTTTFLNTVIVSGIIWSCWHLPGILSGDYAAQGTPLWYQVFCFILMVVSGSVMLAWLRIQSGSLWPAVVFHATHNGVIQAFFDRLTSDTGYTGYFIGEFGIGLAMVSLVIVFLILKYVKVKPVSRSINTVYSEI